MKFWLNVLLSGAILVVGFLGQVGIVKYLGLGYLGNYAIIRLMNSESFVAFYDFGLTEESLYKDSMNRCFYFCRIVVAQIVIFLLASLSDILFLMPDSNKVFVFLLLESSYLVYLLRLNLRKNNLIHTVRNQDLFIGIIAPIVFIAFNDLKILFMALVMVNLFFVTFYAVLSDKVNWVVLDNSKISFNQSLNFYLTTLVAKAEGSALTLLLPVVTGSYSAVGLYDLVFKIPKAFKSQLGELNALIKTDFLNTGNSRWNFRSPKKIFFFVALSFLTFAVNLIYLSYMEMAEIDFIILLTIFEFLLGIFYTYFNLDLVDLYRNHSYRFKYSLFSTFRTATFIFVVLFLLKGKAIEMILSVWYGLSFALLLWIFRLLIRRRSV